MLDWFLDKSLGIKFSGMIIGVVIITMGTLTYFSALSQKNLLLNNLKSKSTTLGHFVSLITPNAILSYDFDTMNDYMKEASAQEDVVYSVLISSNGANLTKYLKVGNIHIERAFKQIDGSNVLKVLEVVNKDPSIISMSFPISLDDKNIGQLLLGISRKNIDDNYHRTLVKILLSITGVMILLSLFIYSGFRFMVIVPILALKRGLYEVSLGNLNNEIKIKRNDEIGSLTSSFNKMSNQLQHSMSQRDKVTLKLKNKTKELYKLHHEERKANKAKSVFLANMSHELRTPLNAVIGYSEMLEEDITKAGSTNNINDLRRIQNAGKHFLTLINDVLDLSKIETGKLELHLEDFVINDVIDDVVGTIFPLLKNNNNEININISPDLGIIHSDATRLRQILFNILGNACKFTNNGIVTFDVEKITNNCDEIKITIGDTGIGISKENINKLFIPFSQIDNSSTRRFDGTGLGLIISKHFCEMMGGSITLKSELNVGSVVTIILPSVVNIIQ